MPVFQIEMEKTISFSIVSKTKKDALKIVENARLIEIDFDDGKWDVRCYKNLNDMNFASEV